MNWLELVSLGKTENSDEHLCGDEHGVRKFRTALWRREDTHKPGRDPLKIRLPVDLQKGNVMTISPNVDIEETPEEKKVQDGAAQRRWCDSLVKGHDRRMGCPRCSSGIGIHNAECVDESKHQAKGR